MSFKDSERSKDVHRFGTGCIDHRWPYDRRRAKVKDDSHVADNSGVSRGNRQTDKGGTAEFARSVKEN